MRQSEKGLEFDKIAAGFRDQHPTEVIRWAVEQVGAERITLACSFSGEDIVLLDCVHQVDPQIPVFYLDTDLLFPETYQLRDRLSHLYQKKFHRVATSLTVKEQAVQMGESLWRQDPHRCCQIRKVEPLQSFLEGYQGWITGIRRAQSPTRAQTEVIAWDPAFQLIKLNPLAFWSEEQVWQYLREKDLPYNPLHDQGYPSIGCHPCTRPVQPGEDARAGRWAGTEKTECGLHNG